MKILIRSFSGLRHTQNLLNVYSLYLKSKWFMKGVSFAALPNCGSNVYFSCTDGGEIIIGRNVSFCSNIKIIARGGRIEIGDNSHIGDGVLIVAKESICIKSDVLIAEYVVIRDHNHNTTSDPIHKAGFTTSAITIERNVWLAAKSTVLKGVHIGEGAVVAAHALVNKSVVSRTIVAGMPAKQVSIR